MLLHGTYVYLKVFFESSIVHYGSTQERWSQHLRYLKKA